MIGGDKVDEEVVDVVEVGSSQHPHKSPGVLQWELVVAEPGTVGG